MIKGKEKKKIREGEEKDMEKKQLEEAFCRKISGELEQFKEEALRMGKEEIFSIAYRIDCMVRIYEMLAEHSGKLGEEELKQCIREEELLQSLYQGWLKAPIPQEEGLEHSIWSEIAKICKCSESEPGNARKKQKFLELEEKGREPNQRFLEPEEKPGMNTNPQENQGEKKMEARQGKRIIRREPQGKGVANRKEQFYGKADNNQKPAA